MRVVRYGNPWVGATGHHQTTVLLNAFLHGYIVCTKMVLAPSVAWRAPNTWFVVDVPLLGYSLQGLCLGATVLLKKGCQGHKISKLSLRRCTGSHEAALVRKRTSHLGTVRTRACFFFSRVVFPYAPQPRTLREGPAHNSLLAWT